MIANGVGIPAGGSALGADRRARARGAGTLSIPAPRPARRPARPSTIAQEPLASHGRDGGDLPAVAGAREAVR